MVFPSQCLKAVTAAAFITVQAPNLVRHSCSKSDLFPVLCHKSCCCWYHYQFLYGSPDFSAVEFVRHQLKSPLWHPWNPHKKGNLVSRNKWCTTCTHLFFFVIEVVTGLIGREYCKALKSSVSEIIHVGKVHATQFLPPFPVTHIYPYLSTTSFFCGPFKWKNHYYLEEMLPLLPHTDPHGEHYPAIEKWQVNSTGVEIKSKKT